jgi:hypothetical protein
MVSKSVAGNIQITAWRELRLQAGELVSLSVLKQLAEHRWAVGIQGRVFPAFSKLDLVVGTAVRARVSLAGGKLIFTIERPEANPTAAVLARQGLPGGRLSELIASALLRAGQPVSPELVEKIKSLLERTPLRKERAARNLAALLDKGIDLTSPAAQSIMEWISFGEKGSRDHRRHRERGMPKCASAVRQELKSLAARPAGEAGGLAVFNHLKGKNQSWIVIPFLFSDEGNEYPGTMKLLFDPFQARPLAFTLTVAPNGGAEIAFHLRLTGKKSLSVFAGDRRMRSTAGRSLGRLASNLHNLGIEVDDTIHGEESFDGFSPAWEGAIVREVDTVG